MGKRKRLSAEQRKEAKKSVALAKLLDIPTSPRKMRLVADMVRGQEVFRALGILKFSNKEAAARLEKLVRRIRKRSNHVTVIVGTKDNNNNTEA